MHESNDNLQKKSTQDKSWVKISGLSASGTAESSRSPTKASTWNRSPFDKSCRMHIRKMEMESFKSAMNQAQINWKCNWKCLCIYVAYMYMKSFKPAKQKKGLCFPTSKSMQRNESQPSRCGKRQPPSTFCFVAALHGFPQSPCHPSEFSDVSLRYSPKTDMTGWENPHVQ